MGRLRPFYFGMIILAVVGWLHWVRQPILHAQGERTPIYVLTFEGAVTPVLERYIEDGIQTALAEGAGVLVLQLDTPGGSVNITKSIVQKMLVSPVPIVVYVAPTGAHAGSAGTFITLAGHASSMAPGASIGAASPVGSGGEDVGETMEAKVKNILSADIENLAERRGEERPAGPLPRSKMPKPRPRNRH
ncbi:MAG: hypothetical protein HC802_15480 [Caldilineaceae bacterium]|nr:hypothetical protein [Caldilineaceae bacterium]